MTGPLIRVPLPRPVRLPDGPPEPVDPPDALAHPAPATPAAFELCGRRVRVVLSGTRGVETLEADGVPLLRDLGVAGAAGANLLAGPRTARRECFAGGRSVVETVLVPEALPGCVVQWSHVDAHAAAPPPVVITAQILPPPDGDAEGDAPRDEEPTRIHAAPGLLWVSRGDRGLLLHVPGCSGSPTVTVEEGRLLVAWRIEGLAPGTPVTLLAQAAPPEAPWTSPKALAGLRAHHLRGESASLGSDEPGVALETGVPELDLGVRWARAWMRDRHRAVPGRGPDLHPLVAPGDALAALPSGMALAGALGEAGWLGSEFAAAWFAAAAASSGDRDAGRSAFPPDGQHPGIASAAWAMALARWTAWTGETALLRDHADRILELLGDGGKASPVPTGWGMPLARAMAEAAEAAEIPEIVDAAGSGFREAGDRTGSGGKRLPVVGGGPATAPPALLLPGRGHLPVRDRLSEALAVREALGGLARDPRRDLLAASPLLLLALVEGMLGAVPDAVFGRLTLSPLLPPNWTRFRAPGLRCGEGTLELVYRREAGRARWTLRPQTGSVPLMVIFEPWHPFREVRSVTVDGSPAELDRRGEEGWTRIALQVPVDGIRVVEVEGESVTLP